MQGAVRQRRDGVQRRGGVIAPAPQEEYRNLQPSAHQPAPETDGQQGQQLSAVEPSPPVPGRQQDREHPTRRLGGEGLGRQKQDSGQQEDVRESQEGEDRLPAVLIDIVGRRDVLRRPGGRDQTPLRRRRGRGLRE